MKRNHSKQAIRSFHGDKPGYSNTSTNDERPLSLRVSEKYKYKNDKQWFKDMANYLAPYVDTYVNNYKEMKTCYEVLNNDLTGFRDRLDSFLNPLGEDVGQIKESVLPYAKLHNYVNVLKGELLKRGDNHKIILLCADAIKNKNDKLLQAIKSSVEEKVQIAIQSLEAQMQGKSEEEIQKIVEDLRTQEEPEDIAVKDFKSDSEIFFSKALHYCKYTQDIKTKKMDTFNDVIASDRMFIYSGFKHGKPYLEVLNPLYVSYHKASNERKTNKADYFSYRKPITRADAYQNYGHMLTNEELESLGFNQAGGNLKVDERHSLDPRYNDLVFDHTDEQLFRDLVADEDDEYNSHHIGLNQANGTHSRYDNEDFIWETHTEFKAFKKVIFLTYFDEYNKEITLAVSEKFKIPKSAKKEKFMNKFFSESEKYVWYDEIMQSEMTAEIMWIPRKYEVIRLGSDVYPICREVPFQEVDVESPYSNFNLSIFGAVFTARNAESVSLVQRALPSYFQYIYVKHIQNRELAKYQGAIQSIDVDQIPDELGEDAEGNSIRDKVATYLLYLKRSNKDFYSGSQSSLGNLPPATRSPGSSGFMLGTAVELMNLQQMLELLSVEIGMAMGISPQRLSEFSSNSNVSDNRQAITQSSHITEPYFYLHDQIWSEALSDYLDNFSTWARLVFERNPDLQEHELHYVLPNGSTELLKITRSDTNHKRIGLYTTSSGQDQVYLNSMMELSQAFSQNPDSVAVTSSLIKAISQGASPEETHKLITIEANKQSQRLHEQQLEQQKQQQALQERQENIMHAHREDIQKHELEKIDRKGMWDVKIREIDAVGNAQENDINSNNIPDALEIEKFKHQITLDSAKIDLENRKLDDKQLDRDQKDKHEASKRALEEKKLKKQSTPPKK